jgi:hypothetical protein
MLTRAGFSNAIDRNQRLDQKVRINDAGSLAGGIDANAADQLGISVLDYMRSRFSVGFLAIRSDD